MPFMATLQNFYNKKGVSALGISSNGSGNAWITKLRFLFNNFYPSVCIRLVAILDSAEFVIQFLADRAGFAVFGYHIVLVGIQIVDFRNRSDNGSGSALGCFVERSDFFQRDRTTLDSQAHVFSQLLQTLVRNGRKDRVRLRCDVAISPNTEEVSRSALVELFLFLRVKI